MDRPESFGAVDLFHHPSLPKLHALPPGEIVRLGYFPNLAMPSILTLPPAIASQSKAAMLLVLKQSNHGHPTLYTAAAHLLGTVVPRTRTVRYIQCLFSPLQTVSVQPRGTATPQMQCAGEGRGTRRAAASTRTGKYRSRPKSQSYQEFRTLGTLD